MSNKRYKYQNNQDGPTAGGIIQEILPELMIRNIKLGSRLKSKLKVSSLLNNIELRNQNYLKELVSSSDRNVQDLKSGLELSKAMKLSSNKLSLLNSKILNDCFMKKNNVIFNTKKNLNRSTEEETNLIIKKSLNVIRDCISPTYKILVEPKTQKVKKKFLSDSELSHAKMVIDNKISVEEKILKEKIKDYLNRVKTLNLSKLKSKDENDYKIQKLNKDKNREFYFFAKHLSLNDKNIKENLFPNIKSGEINSENYVNINNSNGVKIINGMKLYTKLENNRKKQNNISENENKNNYSDIVVNNKKDSFNILKKIIIRNRSLINKSNSKYNKLSSLLDINLPKITYYETLINKEKKKEEEEKNKEHNNINNENILSNKTKIKTGIPKLLSNSEIMKEFKAIKDEIEFLKRKKIDVEENYLRHQEQLSNIVYIFEKKKVKNKKDNLNDKDQLIKNKVFSENPMIRMPSSHSVSILKRKFKINSGISNKYNRPYRNLSNHTRDRTSASSIKYSASSIISTSKSENKYRELYNYIKKEKKNILTNSLENPALYSLHQEKSYNISKNNINSSNITSMSDI